MIDNSTNPFDLSGRTAIIIGAGGGIGSAISLTLAEAGSKVIGIDRDAKMIEKTGASNNKNYLSSFGLDITDCDSVYKTSEKIKNEFGAIDILINCAGVVDNIAAEDITVEQWRRVMSVNLDGLFWCCQSFGKQMLDNGSGVIVNIASMSGVVVNKPQPQASYNASKAGVIMLTKSLAAEWADRGVRVNSVSPGYIGTELTKRGLKNPVWKKTWLEMTPMSRTGQPFEVANAVWFLASDASSFATGTNLVIDGGYTSW